MRCLFDDHILISHGADYLIGNPLRAPHWPLGRAWQNANQRHGDNNDDHPLDALARGALAVTWVDLSNGHDWYLGTSCSWNQSTQRRIQFETDVKHRRGPRKVEQRQERDPCQEVAETRLAVGRSWLCLDRRSASFHCPRAVSFRSDCAG